MAKLAMLNARANGVLRYHKLKGIDLSKTSSEVTNNRAIDMCNIISDEGGNPRKRKGYKTLRFCLDEIPITAIEPFNNDIFFCITSPSHHHIFSNRTMIEQGHVEFVIDNALWSIEKETDDIWCKPIFHNGNKKLVIFGGKEIKTILYTNQTYETTSEAYVPTTIIARSPTGGGTIYEPINKLTKVRKENFINTGNNTTFVCGNKIKSIKSIKYLDNTGVWQETTALTINGAKVTVPQLGTLIDFQDNVIIEYEADVSNANLSDITSSNIRTSYDKRVFVSGNKNKPQHIWYSEPNNPLYFPDVNYIFVGGTDRPIKNLLRKGNYLVVLKDGFQTEDTVYFLLPEQLTITKNINDTITQETINVYATKQIMQGIGGIASKSYSTLNEEPLILTNNGICGISQHYFNQSMIIKNRSAFIDNRLKQEKNLHRAIATTYKNYYALFVNGHVYVLDGRHKSTDDKNNSSFLYEAYYWNDVPNNGIVTTCTVINNKLYFGTSDGRLCVFKDSGKDTDYSDDNRAVKAYWKTPYTHFNIINKYKTLNKKGCVATISPSDKMTINIYASKDFQPNELIGTFSSHRMATFENLTFDKFTFNTLKTPNDSNFKKKIKKFKRLSLTFENNNINENFMLIDIVLSYKITKNIK